MKIKEAVKKAKRLGYKWVAVDESLEIYAFNKKPYVQCADYIFDSILGDEPLNIGKYTGSKYWTKTLKGVR